MAVSDPPALRLKPEIRANLTGAELVPVVTLPNAIGFRDAATTAGGVHLNTVPLAGFIVLLRVQVAELLEPAVVDAQSLVVVLRL